MGRLLSSDRDFTRFLATRDPARVAWEAPLTEDEARAAVRLWPPPETQRRAAADIAAYADRKSQTVPNSSGGLFHTQNAPTGADRSL